MCGSSRGVRGAERAAGGGQNHAASRRGRRPPADIRPACTGKSHCARCRSGSVAPPAARTSSISRRPGHDQGLLIGEQHALAGRALPLSVGISPAAPTIAAMTMSTPRRRDRRRERLRAALDARRAARRAQGSRAPARRRPASLKITVSGGSAAPARRRSPSCAARRALATRKRSGCIAITASVLAPMLPVDPRIATPRTPLM